MDINICDYGSLDTGKPCTRYIQKAIDDCFLSGGGEVIIPTGVYSVGGLRLRSGVTLHLLENAVLMGSIDPDEYNDYLHDTIEPISKEERESYAPTAKKGASLWEDSRPHSRWNNAIIRAIHAKNIAIIGEYGSEINGQNCFDAQGEEGYRGPHAINMWFCENVTLRGYTVRDSANWAHAIQNSQNIMVSELMVLGGHDGFDVRTCDNITIENCRFLTGDDCIAGFDNIGVTVRNCYFESSCNMLRFGGTDVLVENCTFDGTAADYPLIRFVGKSADVDWDVNIASLTVNNCNFASLNKGNAIFGFRDETNTLYNYTHTNIYNTINLCRVQLFTCTEFLFGKSEKI